MHSLIVSGDADMLFAMPIQEVNFAPFILLSGRHDSICIAD